jgi:DNA-binding transcriptional MerR regulator
MAGSRIGALADRTGASAPTIRYYEEIGLLRRADRQSGGQRVYGEDDISRLTFIRRCRDIDLSIEQVRALMALAQDPERSCMEARDIAKGHLTEVRSKLRELKALERDIASFVASCDRSCAGGVGSDCVILQDLGRPRPRKR